MVPLYSAGDSGLTLWSIYYTWATGSTLTAGNDAEQTHDYGACGIRKIYIALTLGNPVDPTIGAIVIQVIKRIEVQCAALIWWAESYPAYSDLGASGKFATFLIMTNTGITASGVCTLVSPQNPNDGDNEVNCPPGTATQLQLPASYTCGPIKVKAVGEEIADPTNTVTLETTITSNPCPLTATLSLSWAHDASGNQGTLTINASSNRASADPDVRHQRQHRLQLRHRHNAQAANRQHLYRDADGDGRRRHRQRPRSCWSCRLVPPRLSPPRLRPTPILC